MLKILNSKKELLNKINVFPIADGDAGRNLCTTLECINTIQYTNLKSYLETLSSKTTMSARGSSGNILALYIMGLSQNYSDNLTEMCTKAAQFAWDTMYEPVEGTILTAMKDVPKSYIDYKDFIYQFIQNTYKNLFNGPDLLPVLKDNNTLDSGTLGFLYILCGIYKELTEIDLSPELDLSEPLYVNNYSSEDRYCVELLLDYTNSEVKSLLNNYGSELIFMALPDKIKLHIHTKDYNKILEICQEFGSIIEYKIEDMFNENERIYL